MMEPATLRLDQAPHVRAVDGSDVTVLLRLDGGSMAHVALEAGRVSRAPLQAAPVARVRWSRGER